MMTNERSRVAKALLCCGVFWSGCTGDTSGAPSSETQAHADASEATGNNNDGGGSGSPTTSGHDAASNANGKDAGASASSSGGSDAASGVSETDASMVASGTGNAGSVVTYGQPYTGGQFHLGPVDWDETAFHNACASGTKYLPATRAAEGSLLVGLWQGIPNVAQYCDACIQVQTAKGKSAVLRVVTYGDTSTNSIDVSPDAFSVLDSGEFPRTATWQFAKCPDTGALSYEFKSGAHEYWTSFWVRNARVPIAKVETMGPTHGYTACTQEGDGSLVDGAGLGRGTFSIRVTAVDGQQTVDTFAWPSAGIGGQLLVGHGNFQ